MSLFLIALVLFGVFSPKPIQAKEVRAVFLSERNIETIFLKPGYSTALKFDKKPRPAIIGNQESFLVETFQNIVAIKALSKKSKTNLFIFTREGNFNFKLVSGAKPPDTLVQVKRKYKPDKIHFNAKVLRRKSYPLIFTVHKVLFPKSKDFVSVYFSLFLEGDTKKKYLINDFKFLFFQNRNKIPLKKIFVDKQRLSSQSRKLTGHILLRSQHIVQNKPLYIRILRKSIKKSIFLKIPLL